MNCDGKQRVFLVALTGGPCGGKTSALQRLRQVLTEQGFTVFTVPEAATLLHKNGAYFPGLEESQRERLLVFEEGLISLEIALEDAMCGLARMESRPVVVLCDRGLLDIRAYVTEEIWEGLLRRVGVSEEALLQRYELVVHLVTAADGAEHAYTLSNNAARIETPVQARELDEKARVCWSAHPALHRIDNSGGRSFEDKLKCCADIVLNHLLQRISNAN